MPAHADSKIRCGASRWENAKVILADEVLEVRALLSQLSFLRKALQPQQPMPADRRLQNLFKRKDPGHRERTMSYWCTNDQKVTFVGVWQRAGRRHLVMGSEQKTLAFLLVVPRL